MNPIIENEFGTKKITPLFWKYSLLALAGQLFQSCSLIADGIFIGNGIGGIGLAAFGIIAPFLTFFAAMSGLFTTGAATMAATQLGSGDKEGARQVYGTTVAAVILFSVLFSVMAIIFREPLLTAFGATESILPFAKEYLLIWLIGFPFCMLGGLAYAFTRIEEKPGIAALGYMLPIILTIPLEFFLIFKLKIGMAGAALPWIISVGFSSVLLLYLQAKGKVFRIKASDFKLDFKLLGKSLKIGFATFIIQICTTIATIIINNQIVAFGGGELEIGAFGIINGYIAFLVMLVCNSFVSGLQPIVSFNRGAGYMQRVAKTIKTAILQGGLAIVTVVALVLLFIEPISGIFAGTDQELARTCMDISKIFLLMYAFGTMSMLVSGYYVAVEKVGLSILTAVSRIILFAVPLLFILPHFWGIQGIWIAQPSADILAFALSTMLILREYHLLKQQ
ncbi:hypothetical protein LK494_04320 [Anaerovorax odorimutans]|nr:hypothetical protein [Anaerovorax odorimutans]